VARSCCIGSHQMLTRRSSITPAGTLRRCDVAELRPDLMEFLALPPLSSVVLQASGFEVQQGDVTLTPAPESYAHAKQHGVELPEHLKGSA
jgi:hypothetical protein